MEPQTTQTPAPSGNGATAQVTGDSSNNGQPTAPQTPAQPSTPPGEQAVDWETKFKGSSSENERFLHYFKKNGIDPKTFEPIQQTQPPANAETFLSDDELEAAFPGYSAMDPAQQVMMKNIQQFPKMMQMVAEMYNEKQFNQNLSQLKSKPEYALIGENEKDFIAFANKPENIKIQNLEILADAFIGQKLRSAPQPKPAPAPKKGMETGSVAGVQETGEMTPEQISELRKNDPRKYAELARKGKLKF